MKFKSAITYIDPATHEAIRTAAFEERMSMSEWIGCVLGMAIKSRQQRQRKPAKRK